MVVQSHRFMLYFFATLLVLQVVWGTPTGGGPVPKRPGSPSNPQEPKKAKIEGEPAKEEAKKTVVGDALKERQVNFGTRVEKYYANFWAQKATAPNAFFKNNPTPGKAAPTFTDDEIKGYAKKHFEWLESQPFSKNQDFFSYETTDKTTGRPMLVCKGFMVTDTWIPGHGIGASSIPKGDLKQAEAPVLYGVLGSKPKHAEDGSYIEIETGAPLPAGATKYPAGTVAASWGYQPSAYTFQSVVRGEQPDDADTKKYDEGCELKPGARAGKINPCVGNSSGRQGDFSCTTVGRKLGVRFL